MQSNKKWEKNKNTTLGQFRETNSIVNKLVLDNSTKHLTGLQVHKCHSID